MTISKYVRLAVAGAGLFGVVGGVSLERLRSKYGQVSAAQIVPQEVVPPEPGINATRTAQIMRFGFPGYDNLRSLDDFILSYDRRNRVAHWVFEHFTKESLLPNNEISRSHCEFEEDASVHPFFRARNLDYRGSGYDRGHLAAASNHRLCQEHVDQTFLLSNVAPQVGVGFNRHVWNKLERYVRGLVHKYKNVYVVTGPLYLPRKMEDGKMYVIYQVIGTNHVAVPTHFFKVVVGETNTNKLHLETYVLPNAAANEDESLDNFLKPLESVERAAGLLFFDKIPLGKFQTINKKKPVVELHPRNYVETLQNNA